MFFGHKLTDPGGLLRNAVAFLAFSFVASAVYIINDINDIESDSRHPRKKLRPIASGALKIAPALCFAAVLLVVSPLISIAFLPQSFLLILFSYLALNLGYTFFLKHIAVVDVVCIATGFVLRVFAGGVVTPVYVSGWILIMTFMVALLLALGKRRDDLLLNSNGTPQVRKSLNGYRLKIVSQSMVLLVVATFGAYLMYCGSHKTITGEPSSAIYITAIWVALGLLRYLWIALVQGRSGSPTEIFSRDRLMLCASTGWILTFYWLMYLDGP